MKIKLLVVVVMLSTFALNAQISPIFNRDTTKHENIAIHSSAFFGKDWFNRNFSVMGFGADYNRKISPKTTLFAGGSIFNVNMSRPLEDKAPRNRQTASLYVGVTHQVNDNLLLSGDIFYNGIFNAIGASVDMLYKLSEDSFFEFSATFQHQLNTSGYAYPVPYGYYDAFHPFVFGY